MAYPLTKRISEPKLKYFTDFIMKMWKMQCRGNVKYHNYDVLNITNNVRLL
ncbi:hypothetical protein H8356DRAFT_1327219 [Neocallimastix lanati (nom. inval.)]|nr:hypothetical protein H8356DRAFT_1327219 [Neocallimastix sp. JGI-2020a]